MQNRSTGALESATGWARPGCSRCAAMAARDYAQPGIRAQVYDKDIGIIAEFAAELCSPTPLFSLAAAFYQAALAQGYGDDDASPAPGRQQPQVAGIRSRIDRTR